jgi:hypothetical protein
VELTDRKTWILLAVAGLVITLIGFTIGRVTAPTEPGTAADTGTVSESDTDAESDDPGANDADEPEDASQSPLGDADPSTALIPPDTERPEELPVFGTPEAREEMVQALAEAGNGISSRETLLWVADSVCYDLTRLSEQGRSPAFAVRVVWNETLRDLDRRDAAGFGAVFAAAPAYLCPDVGPYGEEVAYWLGF